jgi:hypothetical protein
MENVWVNPPLLERGDRVSWSAKTSACALASQNTKMASLSVAQHDLLGHRINRLCQIFRSRAGRFDEGFQADSARGLACQVY